MGAVVMMRRPATDVTQDPIKTLVQLATSLHGARRYATADESITYYRAMHTLYNNGRTQDVRCLEPMFADYFWPLEKVRSAHMADGRVTPMPFPKTYSWPAAETVH